MGVRITPPILGVSYFRPRIRWPLRTARRNLAELCAWATPSVGTDTRLGRTSAKACALVEQSEYRIQDEPLFIHRVSVGRSEAHVAKARQREISAPILHVSFPSIVRQPTVGFDDEAPFDDHVDTAYSRHRDLKVVLQPSAVQDHSENCLLTGFGATVYLLAEVLVLFRHSAEQARHLIQANRALEECVVDGRDGEPWMLASHSLGKSVDDANTMLRGAALIDERPPVQLSTIAVAVGQPDKPAARTSEPRHPALHVNVGKSGVENEDARIRQSRDAAQSATDPSCRDALPLIRRKHVVVAPCPNEMTRLDGSS